MNHILFSIMFTLSLGATLIIDEQWWFCVIIFLAFFYIALYNGRLVGTKQFIRSVRMRNNQEQDSRWPILKHIPLTYRVHVTIAVIAVYLIPILYILSANGMIIETWLLNVICYCVFMFTLYVYPSLRVFTVKCYWSLKIRKACFFNSYEVKRQGRALCIVTPEKRYAVQLIGEKRITTIVAVTGESEYESYYIDPELRLYLNEYMAMTKCDEDGNKTEGIDLYPSIGKKVTKKIPPFPTKGGYEKVLLFCPSLCDWKLTDTDGALVNGHEAFGNILYDVDDFIKNRLNWH